MTLKTQIELVEIEVNSCLAEGTLELLTLVKILGQLELIIKGGVCG